MCFLDNPLFVHPINDKLQIVFVHVLDPLVADILADPVVTKRLDLQVVGMAGLEFDLSHKLVVHICNPYGVCCRFPSSNQASALALASR